MIVAVDVIRARRIGLLATTGTLRARVYDETARRIGREVETVSLLDLTADGRSGERLQEELLMEPVYGPLVGGLRRGGGLKSGLVGVPQAEAAARLSEAVGLLGAAGADVVILACTEVPMVLREGSHNGVPVVDPLGIMATAAVEIAAGARILPALEVLSIPARRPA